MKIKYFIAPLVVALLFSASNFSATAEETTKSLGYTPVSQELHINPGDSYTDKITVWHQADDDMEYFVEISGFKQIEDHPGTAVLLTPEQDRASETSASEWFHIETESFIVPPSYNFELNYLIDVPEDAAPGEYYAQVFLYTKEDQKAVTDSVVTYSNLAGGPTFLIKTGDDLTESLDILEFKATQKFYENPDLTFTTNVHNTGNVHLKPTGIIVLTNMFGQELATIDFNPDKKTLIRDSLATYINEWESNYLFAENGNLALGPITAELTVYYASESPGYQPATAETEFWILQWKLGLAILGAIVVLVWGIKASKKSKVKDVTPTEVKKEEKTKEKKKDDKETTL